MFEETEKILLFELHREFLDIAKLRKIKFKVVNIQLFDSSSKWGEFDSLTKAICISRKLIHKFSWNHVIGVLKHEMAHQLVFENYNNADIQTHGKEFHEACEKLMVPPMYAASKVELVDENPDFSMNGVEINPLIEKVKKLMSLATSSNEHEANLAAAKVRELYLKYNLEQIGLGAPTEMNHLVIHTGKKRLSLVEKKIISVLVEFYFVKVIVTQQFDAKKLEHHQALEILGRTENILMAEYVYQFLLRSCEEITKQTAGRQEKNSFKIGILDGFIAKLKSENVTAVAPKSRELLMVCDAELEDYMHDYFPRLRSLRSTGQRLSTAEYNRGLQQGRQMRLNKPLSEKRFGLTKLLC